MMNWVLQVALILALGKSNFKAEYGRYGVKMKYVKYLYKVYMDSP